jgi:uncharacterized protein
MSEPDLEAVRRYCLGRLERELPEHYYYHSAAHTRDEVVPAAEELGRAEGVSDEDMLLLVTAAYFHDIGYIERIDGHEAIGIRIARDVLPGLGYTIEQIEVIETLILDTRLPHAPSSHLGMILDDADLDHLGRKSFWQRTSDLRREMAATGSTMSDQAWYERTLEFMKDHHYYTDSAIRLRLDRKNRNMGILAQLIERCSQAPSAPPAT